MASFSEALISFLSTSLSFLSVVYCLLFVHDLRFFGVTTVLYKPSWSPSVLANPVLNDVLLVCVFGLQHSGLARKRVRSFIERHLLESKDSLYPSFYALSSAVVLLVNLSCWAPVNGTVWSLQSSWLVYATLAVNVTSWCLVFVSVLSIHWFELCGAEPLLDFLLGKMWFQRTSMQTSERTLVTNGLYGIVRHPTMFFIILGFWAFPVMTLGRLIFCIGMTMYIAFAVRVFEEPDLIKMYGSCYLKYKKKVPYQLIPGIM